MLQTWRSRCNAAELRQPCRGSEVHFYFQIECLDVIAPNELRANPEAKEATLQPVKLKGSIDWYHLIVSLILLRQLYLQVARSVLKLLTRRTTQQSGLAPRVHVVACPTSSTPPRLNSTRSAYGVGGTVGETLWHVLK